MKAKNLLFNGEIFNITGSLKAEIQTSFDKSIPGAIIVNDINIQNDKITIKIERRCKCYYEVAKGLISLDDAIIFSGVLNKKSNTKIPLGPLPYADRIDYSLHPEDLINSYNEFMKGNDRLIEMKVDSNENEVIYELTFKA